MKITVFTCPCRTCRPLEFLQKKAALAELNNQSFAFERVVEGRIVTLVWIGVAPRNYQVATSIHGAYGG